MPVSCFFPDDIGTGHFLLSRVGGPRLCLILADVSWEGPFDAYCAPMDTGDCSLVSTGLPHIGFTSYTGPAVADTDPAFGIQMHHPRFLEFIKAHESARLLFRSPAFWVQNMDTEDAVAAAINLQTWTPVLMSLNLQILCQFVTSLQQMSSEVLSLALGQVVFPSSEVAALSSAPRAPLAAHYMLLWGHGAL